MNAQDLDRGAKRVKPPAAWQAIRTVLLLVGVLGAGSARADKDEVYMLVGYEGGVSRYRLPAAGEGSVNGYGGAVDATAYYGWSNALHVGGRIRGTSSSDVHFGGASVTVPDGRTSAGDVYVDHRALGLGALVLFRFSAGYSVVPALELEAGFAVHQYRNIIHVPAGASVSLPLSNVTQTVAHGSATLLLEYRFKNHWVVASGAGVQLEEGLAPWSVFVPVRMGRIW
jgi:hypothetical protein